MTAAEIQKLRAVDFSDEGILHVVVLASFFNYLNRVADAVDIEFDYESPLPRMVKNSQREPTPRPSSQSPRDSTAAVPLAMGLAARPRTAAAFGRWREYVFGRDAPLSKRERRVVARAAAGQLVDFRTLDRMGDAQPRNEHETILAQYAETLTLTPWRLDESGIDRLRGLGLDDAGVLDVISVAAFQNTASRLELVLSAV